MVEKLRTFLDKVYQFLSYYLRQFKHPTESRVANPRDPKVIKA